MKDALITAAQTVPVWKSALAIAIITSPAWIACIFVAIWERPNGKTRFVIAGGRTRRRSVWEREHPRCHRS